MPVPGKSDNETFRGRFLFMKLFDLSDINSYSLFYIFFRTASHIFAIFVRYERGNKKQVA